MDKNKKNVPKIRFPGFTEPWEQRKFCDVLETVSDYVAAGSFADLAKNVEYKNLPDYAQLVRTTDLKNGFMSSQEVYVDKKAFEFLYRVNMDKECIILPNIGNCGEVYYVKPQDLPYERNVLGPNAVFVRSECAINSFLSILFQAKDFQTKLKLIVSPNGQTKFNKTELKAIDLILPSNINEQRKIGAYFNNLDNLITLHQRKLQHLQDKKKGLLQKMFPKKGEKVPELRFPGFTDPWEQRKLGELVTQVIREIDKPNEPYWRMSVRSHAKGTFHQFVDDPQKVAMEKLYVVHEDDLVVNITFAWEHAIAVASKEDTGMLVSHRFPMYRSDGKSDIKFLKYLVSQEYFRKKMDLISPGGAGRNRVLSKSDFLKIQVIVPCKIEEQASIGLFFSKLDNLITLHQRKLQHLQEQKKGLLQQMFI